MYGGYSDKANVLCNATFAYETSGVGATGKVVVWLRVFPIFLAVTLGLFDTLALYANRTFNRETYEQEERKKFGARHQGANQTSSEEQAFENTFIEVGHGPPRYQY